MNIFPKCQTSPVMVQWETQRKRNLDYLNPWAHSTTALIPGVSPQHSLIIYVQVQRQTDHQPLFFGFVSGAVGQTLTSIPPLFTWCDCNRLFLDFIVQEKRYLCVQILTDVCPCCLSATVEGWAGFRILNKLLFSFHTLLYITFFAVLFSCHIVSVEHLVL